MKILLDTDIGSDIDDALCLAWLLAQPRCQLLGITTVSGEATTRAAMASALCRAAGREVPIYPGAEEPLLAPQLQPHVPQAEMLARWPHETEFPQGEAVAFLRRTIRAHPGEVTLLAIGPMTNLALLFALDAGIPRLLRGLVLMAGRFAPPPAAPAAPLKPEWNARCDPHALARVYRAPVPLHRSVGLDVTTQVTMTAEEARARMARGPLRPVLDFAEVWLRTRPLLSFHDPLAALSIFEPDACTFARGTVRVELCGEAAGQTDFQPDGSGPHEVALGVDAALALERYFAPF